jgi:rhomboid protease GluP
VNELVATFATYQRLLLRVPWIADQVRLFVFAFCGRTAMAGLLLQQTSLASWPLPVKTYWQAVTDCAAGAVTQGQAALTSLANSAEGLTRHTAQAFLDRYTSANPPPVAAAVLTATAQQQLAQIEQDYLHAIEAGANVIGGQRPPLVTYLLLAVNLAVFGWEVLRGILENPIVLFDLGAMAPAVVLWQGEWWRLLTSTFLHFNVMHIAFNLLALWFLGRLVERRLGAVRFLVVYLLSGVLSMGMYVVLLQLGWVSMYTLVVGASGSIMGLIGAEAAILLRLWRTDASRIARQHFLRALLFVLLQASMDLLIPQFSFTGHLSGALFGFVLASLLYRRQTVPYRPTPATVPTTDLAVPTE